MNRRSFLYAGLAFGLGLPRLGLTGGRAWAREVADHLEYQGKGWIV